MQKKYVSSTYVAMLLLIVFGTCGGCSNDTDSETGEFWEKGTPGGSLTVAFDGEMTGFNTLYGFDTEVDLLVHNLVFAAPIRQHPISGAWIGQLAESWEFIEDMRGIRITLRKGLKWSDGTSLDAEDVVRSLNEVYLNEDIGSHIWEILTDHELSVEVKKEDERSFTIVLDKPHYQLLKIAGIFPLPDEIIDSVPAGDIGLIWTTPEDIETLVTCGPFTLKSYTEGESVELKANNDYPLKDEWKQSLPYLDELRVILIEPDSLVEVFDTKDNILQRMRYPEMKELFPEDEIPSHIYDLGIQGVRSFIAFNMNPKEGDDEPGISDPQLSWNQERKFRQAIAALVNRNRINKELFEGNGIPNYTIVKPGTQHLSEAIESEYLRYDPARAEELLDELEYIDRDGDGFREDPDGNVVELELITNYPNELRIGTTEILEDEAQKVGLRIVSAPDDWGHVIPKLTATHDYEMVAIGIGSPPWSMWNSSNIVPSWGGLHLTYPNQEEPYYEWEKRIDELWIEAVNTPDAIIHKKNFDEIQKIWLEECPLIYTVDAKVLYLSSVELGNAKVDGTNTEYLFLERLFLN